jgi:hypothetical protein
MNLRIAKIGYSCMVDTFDLRGRRLVTWDCRFFWSPETRFVAGAMIQTPGLLRGPAPPSISRGFGIDGIFGWEALIGSRNACLFKI